MNAATISASEKAFNVFRHQRAMTHVRRDEILEPAKAAYLTAHAVHTEDKFLATQILSRLGTLPRHARGLSFLFRQELERVIAGEDPGKAREAIALARNSARGAAGPSRETAPSAEISLKERGDKPTT